MFSANQKPFVICSRVTSFALVLQKSCTPFSANQNWVIFSCILLRPKWLSACYIIALNFPSLEERDSIKGTILNRVWLDSFKTYFGVKYVNYHRTAITATIKNVCTSSRLQSRSNKTRAWATRGIATSLHKGCCKANQFSINIKFPILHQGKKDSGK